MNAEQEAIDAWTDTDEYKTAADPRRLHAPSGMRQYLENRLLHAFRAGMEAGKKIEAERAQSHA